MTDRTLTGRNGMSVTLFAPEEGDGELRASAVMASDAIPEPETFQDETSKRFYRVPAIPRRGLFILQAPVILPEDTP